MKKFLVLMLALLVCACAKKTPQPQIPVGGAEAIWESMLAHSRAASDAPFRDQISLRFGKDGDTRRVTATLWGNGGKIIRLDVFAGVGSLAARILENDDRFLLVSSRENKVYQHTGPDRPLLVIGSGLPWTLADTAALLNGKFTTVFGGDAVFQQTTSSGAFAYKLRSGAVLELDNSGLPIAWSQSDGWNLKIIYGDDSLPKSLRFHGPHGHIAILLVKSREYPETPFTPANMALEIPAGMPVLPLTRASGGLS